VKKTFCVYWVMWLCVPAAPAAERVWDFETGASGWTTQEKGCAVVTEPDNPKNHAYQIVATRPHHTRVTLSGSEKTPNFLITLRVKVLHWKGAPPNVYVYGRSVRGGFHALTLRPNGRGRVFAWYGQNKPAISIGSVGANVGDKPRWIQVAFGCFNEYSFGKAWAAGDAEPGWQAVGFSAGQDKGKVAIGVWTSPRTSSQATVLFDDVHFMPLTAAMVKRWRISLGPRPRLDTRAIPQSPGVFTLADRIGLATKRACVVFDRATGEITNFVDISTKQEFVSRTFKQPLFEMALTKPYEGKQTRVTSREFRKITVRPTSSQALVLDFGDHPSDAVSARVTAALGEDDSVRLRIRVRNDSDWCVASVAFPQMTAPAALSGDGTNDRLLIPCSGGAVIHAPGKRSTNRTAMYPGTAFAQFYALYNDKAGAYVGAYDADGNVKRFVLQSSAGAYVSLTLEHLFPEQPSKDAALSYDVVLRTFQGDWRNAADIYKAWAVRQPWCKRRLAEREDVPSFLKDGSGVIITSIGNPAFRARTVGDHLEKLPDLMDKYREATGLKHMIFVAYGWENRGTWAGINYFPTIPSDGAWRKATAALKKRGHRVAFLTSGFWWVVKRQRTSSGPAFDDTADFERRRAMCSQKPDGAVWKWDYYERTRGHSSWRGLSVRLCHGSQQARDTLKRIFLHVAKLGVSLISFDQEIGGGQREPCYNTKHGHPPGYGRWMWTGFRDLCRDILREGKPIEPELGLFMENESELAIPCMSTYWSRQFGEVGVGAPGGRGVGLFSYLYHEYVTAIGAACVQGQGLHGTRPSVGLRCRILANNLTRGLIQGPFMHEVPLGGGDKWRKQVSRAYRSFCRPYKHFPEYLLLGRTRCPIAVECDNVELRYYRRDAKRGKPVRKGGPPVVRAPLVVPAAAVGSFEAPDGSIAHFIVNTTPEPRRVVALLPKTAAFTIYRADRTKEETARVAEAGRRVSLSLEPFGIRVIVIR